MSTIFFSDFLALVDDRKQSGYGPFDLTKSALRSNEFILIVRLKFIFFSKEHIPFVFISQQNFLFKKNNPY